MRCNFCKSEKLELIIDLGHQPPSNALLTREQLDEPETYYPLKVFFCRTCFLVQIPEAKKAVEIFTEEYPYYSSQSPANVSHAKEYVEMICKRFNLGPKSRVMEIGSNDGYLLQFFIGKVKHIQGYEPSTGAAKAAWKLSTDFYLKYCEKPGFRKTAHYFHTEDKFFGLKTCRKHGQFDLICSINTIAHQPDINDFVEGMKIALAQGGVITAEFPHLLHLIQQKQFDTIYHEHYSYFSLSVLCSIFEVHGLEIFDVEELPEHGGSLRIYAQHKGAPHQRLERVSIVLRKEMFAGLFDEGIYKGFEDDILRIRDDLREVVWKARGDIVAYGAAAKGNTLLNYCRFTAMDIPMVFDRSPHKAGKFLPGSHIPIMLYDRKSIEDFKPGYVLILPWNLKEEIMQDLSFIREWGGKFVVAIPKLEVL